MLHTERWGQETGLKKDGRRGSLQEGGEKGGGGGTDLLGRWRLGGLE